MIEFVAADVAVIVAVIVGPNTSSGHIIVVVLVAIVMVMVVVTAAVEVMVVGSFNYEIITTMTIIHRFMWPDFSGNANHIPKFNHNKKDFPT